MLTKLFKSKRTIQLIAEKEMLKNEIEKLKREIRKLDGLLKCKSDIFLKKDEGRRDWYEMEEKLKSYYKENGILKEQLKERDKILPNLSSKYNYLIPIERYLSGVKLKGVVEILKNIGIEYVQDLDIKLIESLDLEDKVRLNLKNRIEKFHRLEVDWEIKTYLLKGEKIKKIYLKHRRFKDRTSSENLEFMSDLEGYDFESLNSERYLLKEIETIKDLYQNYMKKHKTDKLY